MNTFAARLLQARSAAGLTQKELADAVGVSTVQLSRYEGGKSTPRPRVMAQLAIALGVNTQWLADGSRPADEPEVAFGKPDSDGMTEVSFRPDKHTGELLRLMAARAGKTPEEILKFLITEAAAAYSEHPQIQAPDVYLAVIKRLEELEKKVATAAVQKPKP